MRETYELASIWLQKTHYVVSKSIFMVLLVMFSLDRDGYHLLSLYGETSINFSQKISLVWTIKVSK